MSWNIGASEPAELIFPDDATELTAFGVSPHSGQWALRLGGVRAEIKYLTHYEEQAMIIPANATEVTVTGYLQVRTSEDFDDVYDKAGFQLFADGHPPPTEAPFYHSQPVPTWTNLTAATATDWTMFQYTVDVRSQAGRPMIFRVFADLDTSIPTYFFFDDVSVAVTACGP